MLSFSVNYGCDIVLSAYGGEVMSNPIFEQQPGLVESSFVAKVYSKTNQTSSEIIDALFDEMDSSYGDIDTFIRDAGDDIEALFDELD